MGADDLVLESRGESGRALLRDEFDVAELQTVVVHRRGGLFGELGTASDGDTVEQDGLCPGVHSGEQGGFDGLWSVEIIRHGAGDDGETSGAGGVEDALVIAEAEGLHVQDGGGDGRKGV